MTIHAECYVVRSEDRDTDLVRDGSPDERCELTPRSLPQPRGLWGITWDNIGRAARDLERGKA